MARYTLEKRIGEGGMAEVFRARAEGGAGFKRTCAVKRLLPDLARDSALQKRFIDEARIAGALRHPNVVDVLDFYEEDGVQHLVMEFVDGASLEHLCLRGRGGKFLPVKVAARIASDVGRALEYAHAEGVLHRDVSCCNVLVSREGEVKLADFGLADARDRVSTTEPGGLAGKTLYMSPERRRGETAGPGDDLYALGVVLEQMLLAADPRDRSTDAGEKLKDLSRRLTTARSARIPSASALLAELRALDRASAEDVGEHVRANPQARAPSTTPAPARLQAEDLDDTTDSGHAAEDTDTAADDDTTVAEARPHLRWALAGAALAVVGVVAWILLRFA